MNSGKKTAAILDDAKINIKMKLAALWIVVNLLYLYVDIYSFYRPGMIKSAIAGEVAGFQITQAWLLAVIIYCIEQNSFLDGCQSGVLLEVHCG